MPCIALDLEGTLIQDQFTPDARPHLHRFLEVCQSIGRVVMMTTVPEEKFREIARILVEQEKAPEWFPDLEYINWQRPYKDLRFIPDINPQECVLVDDYEGYVHPEQTEQWLQLETFFELDDDHELLRVQELIRQKRLPGPCADKTS